MRILITGTAGFIGFHLANRLLEQGWEVVGIDSINDYYDVSLKYGRLSAAGIGRDAIEPGKLVQSSMWPGYRFMQANLADLPALQQLFDSEERFDVVMNLAAQAGVRYSLTNPHAYVESNMVGFVNILECCRHHGVGHLAYASSSSVYGLNERIPFHESHAVDHPISLYAASKKSNELMAHTYSHLYGLPTTGLRFFTVYGPWGRPDMALFLFTKAILAGEPIDVFNNGHMERDFTYIDDIVEGLVRVCHQPAAPDPAWSGLEPNPATSRAPYRIYNIGNNAPVSLLDFIRALESKLGRKANMNLLPMQPGDVPRTYADVSALIEELGYKPGTPVAEGIDRFVDWYLSYYGS